MFDWGRKKGRYVDTPVESKSWLIDFEKLFRIIPDIKQTYQRAQPFPHIVLEDFVSEDCLQKVLQEFTCSDQKAKWHDREALLDDGEYASLKKNDTADLLNLGVTTRQLLWELNSRPFIQFLQNVTGIPRLISDPLYYGGGVHQTLPGGLLKVHADFELHPIYQLNRRLNVILYLNKDWPESYGGHLELWDRDMNNCEQRVLPVAGRCVIFNTDRTSFHGHPHPLSCPDNRTRKSMALYYYTNGLDDSPRKPRGATHWQS